MASKARNVILEVERKFTPGLHFIHRLETNTLPPPFRQIQKIKQSNFEDVYHDHRGHLQSKGIWLRARDGIWQAKVRLGGDFTNSQFEEVDSHEEIAKLVKTHVPQADVRSPCFGLPVLARFKTRRCKWLADERFQIVLDATDFGHEIGEVELTSPLPSGPDVECSKQEMTRRMDEDIERFMDTYKWAFKVHSEPPVGKLTAYFARQTKGMKSSSYGRNLPIKHR